MDSVKENPTFFRSVDLIDDCSDDLHAEPKEKHSHGMASSPSKLIAGFIATYLANFSRGSSSQQPQNIPAEDS